MIVEGMIAKGNFVFVAAQSQTGKTLFWLYLCICLALGKPVLGRFKVGDVKRILYLVLEDPPRRIKERILDILREAHLLLDKLHFFIAPGLSIANSAMFLWLRNFIVAGGYDFVVIDTYQKATPGISSFDDEKQSLVLHRVSNLTRKLGITLTALDHIRKENQNRKRNALSLDDVKGTGGKAQNADSVILMEGSGEDRVTIQVFSKDFDQRLAFTAKRSPKGSGLPKYEFDADLSELGIGSKKKGAETKARVLDSVPETGWASCDEVAKKANVSEPTARRYLNQLVKEGKIEENGLKSNGKRYSRFAQNSESSEMSE
jgi:AAA domain